MTAEKAPQRTPEEKAELFIASYQHDYSGALDEARAAAETTGTDAWRTNYKAQVLAHKTIIDTETRTISRAVDAIKGYDTDEDTEKELKGAVKALSEERIRHEAWKSRAVHPYMTKANLVHEIVAQAKMDAQSAEEDSPLINRGLSEQVDAIIARWPIAKWNDAAGVVEIVEPVK